VEPVAESGASGPVIGASAVVLVSGAAAGLASAGMIGGFIGYFLAQLFKASR
jgi:proteasome assembly chaperone (PAC2) family protein